MRARRTWVTGRQAETACACQALAVDSGAWKALVSRTSGHMRIPYLTDARCASGWKDGLGRVPTPRRSARFRSISAVPSHSASGWPSAWSTLGIRAGLFDHPFWHLSQHRSAWNLAGRLHRLDARAGSDDRQPAASTDGPLRATIRPRLYDHRAASMSALHFHHGLGPFSAPGPPHGQRGPPALGVLELPPMPG